MFGRRRRAGSNASSITGPSASSAATTAATSAFLNSRASNASLAAAAAGAALRSRPTTPISVADVQTKRTVRRTGSVSSVGSAQGSVLGRPNSQLQRRGSSGSMTERTFRDPSPSRGGRSTPVVDADAPPVPAIPKNIKPAIPAKSHRRTASLEAPVMRVASPPPNKATGRGSSLGPTGGPPKTRNAGQRTTNLASVSELTGLERADSRGSVNFSYPTTDRPTSPYGQRKLTSPTPSSASQRNITSPKDNLVYDANTRTFRPESEILFLQQRVQDAAVSPVKKKKAATQNHAGAHLAEGSVGGKIKGTAIESSAAQKPAKQSIEQPQQPRPQSQSQPVVIPNRISSPAPAAVTVPKKKKKIVVREPSIETPIASDNESDASERPPQFNTRIGALLAKKPSTIRERDEEDETINSEKVAGRQAALEQLEAGRQEARPTSPLSVQVNKTRGGVQKQQQSIPMTNTDTRQQTRSASQPPMTAINQAPLLGPAETTPKPTMGRGNGSVRGNRVQSVSPARTAHFLVTPEPSSRLSVKHDPPPRSVSPRKSALKHSPSPRAMSPGGDVTDMFVKGQSSNVSDVSDMSSAVSEDRQLSKKKSARVSFDEEGPQILGLNIPAVTPDSTAASPHGKKGWFGSINRQKKKDISATYEDDEIMQPRPALPSFGSVRENKGRDVEVRQETKPEISLKEWQESSNITHEALPAVTETPASPLFTTATGEPIEFPLGVSHDHGIGAIIAEDQAKNVATASHQQEPLPPQVTSVEGSGSNYDSDSSAEGTAQSSRTTAEPSVVRGDSANEYVADVKAIENASSTTGRNVPQLAITQATPTIEESERMADLERKPGNIVDLATDSSLGEEHKHDAAGIGSGRTPDAEAQSVAYGPALPLHEDGLPDSPDVHAHHDAIIEETEESDQADVYSDAAEDLSDVEGDGFMSLNAVVESPIVKVPGRAISTAPESPLLRDTQDNAQKRSQLSRQTSEPQLDEGWDKAQQYWSGLTAEKKAELERAAKARNLDVDSDEEEAQFTPVPKPRKKALKTVAPPSQTASKSTDIASQHRTYQITPGSKAAPDSHVPAMRSSMRAAVPGTATDAVHMRKSLRDNSSSQKAPPKAQPVPVANAVPAKARPVSYSQPEAKTTSIGLKTHTRGNSAAAALPAPVPTPKKTSVVAPPLRRRGSDDSDSSFKKTRRSTEGFSMRTSMRTPAPPPARPQSPDVPVTQNKSSRFSIRSLSPTGSIRRPFMSSNIAAAPAPTMASKTFRSRSDSIESNTPTMRSTGRRAKSPTSSFGFGRSKAETKPLPKSSSRNTSRFADSSDEEDNQPAYRSRIADSSDDEDVPVSAPAQRSMKTLRSQPAKPKIAIPPRTSSKYDNSSDLPETDDEKLVVRKNNKISSILGASAPEPTNQQGPALSSGSLRRSGSGRDAMGPNTTTSIPAPVMPLSPGMRPEQKRRGSFMSAILRRKKGDPDSKVHKSELESAARRDTPLERSRPQLEAVKRQDSNFSVGSGRPKLQKRQSSVRPVIPPIPIDPMETEWPLNKETSATLIGNGENDRPYTSDGVDRRDPEKMIENGAQLGRPDIGSRRVTATGLSGVDSSGQALTLKKKKKFGMLRKAFGLDV